MEEYDVYLNLAGAESMIAVLHSERDVQLSYFDLIYEHQCLFAGASDKKMATGLIHSRLI